MVTVFLAEGFEEIEAITPIDILRRGGESVRTCSIHPSKTVTGAHGIEMTADLTLEELSGPEDLILLPGGMPGTLHLKACKALADRILRHVKNGGALAAICAAPTVLGDLGLLKDHDATCYPAMKEELFCKEFREDDVVCSGSVITSRGAGTAFSFALAILEFLKGKETAQSTAQAMCFKEGGN